MERASERINQIYLVRVDCDTEETRVGVDKLVDISDPQVPQDGGVIEVGQVGHVNAAVELGRVDLSNLVLLPDLFLSLAGHSDLLPLRGLDHSFIEAPSGFVRDPARLLGVVRLVLQLLLQLEGHEEPFGGVGIRTRGFLDVTRHPGGSITC